MSVPQAGCYKSGIETHEARIIIGKKLGWSTLRCVREDHLDPTSTSDTFASRDAKKNIQKCSQSGTTVTKHHVLPDVTDREEIDRGIKSWMASRRGWQVATDSLRPWLDHRHRIYFIARQQGKIVGLTILSKINNGFVVKNCITFPSSPKGCSELMLSTTITDARVTGVRLLTFSASAAERLEPIDNLSGWKVNFLSTIFHQIASKAGLSKRHTFRAKSGARDAPLYVAFSSEAPPGLSAIYKLMK
ncbi:hypothetical protein PROFUN_08113 [Planoprotostelium fungivorum]|uniref:Uncharacterized protein n=1 Tax=Planoprotostelium fungivorum TaxID=1890364 RepID=A0A2P6NKG4_9EUKA|nr:hypothetical protein PROFUN_08113 [Planoprotostelium fungivorum]